jgi:hypothetical protein
MSPEDGASEMLAGGLLPDSAGQLSVVEIKQLGTEFFESANPSQKKHLIAQLVAMVFETAPLNERSRLLAHLLQPLGLLSLMAVANGVFARIRFRSGWPALQIPLDEVAKVQASDIIELVSRVQEVSIQAVDNLVQILPPSPVMAASAVLVAVLMNRRKARSASGAQDAGALN